MNKPPQVSTVQSRARILILVGLAVALAVEPGASQSDYGNRLGTRESGRAIYYSTAPSLRPDAFVPSLKKWYLPQEVANHYRWQWEAGTNYAHERYLRYLATDQEGDNHYDLYGRLLTRGWLIYDWQQSQPRTSEGNLLHKTDRYKDLFSSLVVSADAKGQHHFRVSIGDEIGTTLTPMTFRKTAFNGVQFDYMSDRVAATALLSRINVPLFLPARSFIDEFTNFVGLRAVWNMADFVRIGGTFVNAHNGRSSTVPFDGSPLTGRLSSHQSGARINRITVRLTDDSPADGEGGPALFAHDIEITTRIGELDTVLVGSQIGFQPRVSGGIPRDGSLDSRRRRRTGADPAGLRTGGSGPGGPRRLGNGGVPDRCGQQHQQSPVPAGPEQRLQGGSHFRPAHRQRHLRTAPSVQDHGAGTGECAGPFQPGCRGL